MQSYFSTTLSSSIVAGDTVIPLNAVPNGTEGFLVINQDNSAREIIYFNSKGASSVTCPSAALGRGQGGTTATSHAQGATVKMNFVDQYWSELQNGNALASGFSTLGYAQITTNATATTIAAVSGLSLTVTIPAGTRKVKVSVFTVTLQNSGANVTQATLWQTAVTSGTQLQQYDSPALTGVQGGMTMIFVHTPAAGSYTYAVGLNGNGGTGTITAGATNPAFILVEAI